jgi:hypothetical protein
MKRAAVGALCLCCMGLAPKAFASIVISFPSTQAQVSDGTNLADAQNYDPAGTPAVATLGAYSSATNPVYVTAGAYPSLLATFTQIRPGDYGSYAAGQVNLNFISDINARYTAAGLYSNPSGISLFQSYLFDATDNFTVYNSAQVSVGGPVVFTLGGADGNVANLSEGSLTGTLIAGHTYSWYAATTTQAYPEADLGAEAGGGATLSLQPVPEFSSVIVWSLLALAIGGVCWWQRTRVAAA